MNSYLLDSWTTNRNVKEWIKEIIDLCSPKEVLFIEGTEEEALLLQKRLVDSQVLFKLNPKLRPGSYLARSNPDDVARIEDRTFICSKNKDDSGPTNNWRDPAQMKETLLRLFKGCMKGRTLYIVPYCMGPLKSPWSKVAIEITDSAYVVLNMKMMTHIGRAALDKLGENDFVRCLHSVEVL